MRVFIAGATGVVGKPLCGILTSGGHEVVALTRNEESAQLLRAMGCKPVIADVFDEQAIVDAMSRAQPEVVVHQLTAIPARTHPRRVDRDFAPTNRLRTEGTRILLAAATAARVKRFIAQSISFALAPEGPSPADEEPAWLGQRGSASLHAAVDELERRVMEAKLEGIVLRYGAFYGPGTVFAKGGSFYEDVQHRRLPIVGGGSGVFSFTHVADAAGAVVAALDRGKRGIYNVVDDEPAPVRDWLPHYAECLGAPPPRRVPGWIARPIVGPYGMYLLTKQRGVSNRRAKDVLGWAPEVSSWKRGFKKRLDH